MYARLQSGRYPNCRSLLNRAANAACCHYQIVSEQSATISTVPEFPILCVILFSSIDAILSFSTCRGSAHELCVVWQRIFWSGVVCGVVSRSLWNF